MKRIKMNHLDDFTDDEILDLRLCDLPLSFDHLPFRAQWVQALGELKNRGLRVRPHFWISTEWFCPDGTLGIAVPFFLFHPRLIALERKMMGDVDGGTALSFLKILRHELGHVCDNAFALRKDKLRTQFFGSSKTDYPRHYQYRLYSRNYVHNIGWAYAQSHPDEDFAETFAVWLRPKASWRKQYAGTKALAKLEYLDSLLSDFKHRRPRLKYRRQMDRLSEQKITLREYYRKKQRYYKTNKFRIFDDGLLRYLPENHGSSKDFLNKKIFAKWSSHIAEQLNCPIYKTNQILRGVLQRSHDLRRGRPDHFQKIEPKLLDFLSAQSKVYVQKGLDRVIL
jgi:hypothetical protein